MLALGAHLDGALLKLGAGGPQKGLLEDDHVVDDALLHLLRPQLQVDEQVRHRAVRWESCGAGSPRDVDVAHRVIVGAREDGEEVEVLGGFLHGVVRVLQAVLLPNCADGATSCPGLASK